VRSYFTNLATQAVGGSASAAAVFGSIIPMDYPNRNAGVLDAIINFDLQRWLQHYLPQRGGGGGGSHLLACDTGDVVVGIYGRAGLHVDQIGLTCADRYSDGSLGSTYSRGPYGGTGGSSFSRTCPSDAVAVGLHGRSGQYLDQVGLQCASVSSWPRYGTVTTTTTAAGGSGGSAFDDRCVRGYALTQIDVRSGDYVDAVQGMCRILD
jgi:hypothetical protein